MLSVLDIFRIGVGPSSSHTVGPMRIAARYQSRLAKKSLSLAFTGAGHGTFRAAKLGLLGFKPETIQMDVAEAALERLNKTDSLPDGTHVIVTVDYETPTRLHPNEMVMVASRNDEKIDQRTYYSTGGGFVASHAQLAKPVKDDFIRIGEASPFPFPSAADLLAICTRENTSIAETVLANEDAKRPRAATLKKIDNIAAIMMQSVSRGLSATGLLPGSLKVRRRASGLWDKLTSAPPNEREALFDWLNVFAMAVNEENAAGGQVVTAPTNGAAGIIPSIIRHYCHNEDGSPQTEQIRRFLLTAGGIGLLYKQRASISGAEMGCRNRHGT
jgi:L-serine dehydratase